MCVPYFSRSLRPWRWGRRPETPTVTTRARLLADVPRSSPWFTVAVLVAFLEGAVSGVQVNLSLLLASVVDAPTRTVGFVLPAVAVLGVLTSPVGLFVAGYRWGAQADVPAAYRRFALRVLGAALLGFVLFYAATIAAVVAETGVDVLAKVLFDWLYALGLASAPLIAVGSGAIGYYRSVPRSDQ